MALDVDGIFLDTNVFESAKFDLSKRNFKNLIDICNTNDLTIYVDEVVKNEVFKRIEKVIDKSVSKLSKQDLEYINRVSKLPANTVDLKVEILRAIKKEMNDFFDNSVEIIPCNYFHEDLLTLYFDKIYPFEDRKKEEFPDAIMLLSLKKFSNDSEQKIMLISNDNGVLEFCNNNGIHSANFISEALDYINDKLMLNKFYKESIDKIREEITKYIIENNVEFLFHGYTYEDSIYAENYEVNNVKIKEVYLVEEDDENKSLSVTCEMEIDFTVTTESYPDYEMGIYDKEDGVWFTFSYLQTTFTARREINLDFEIQVLDYDDEDLYITCTSNIPEFEFDVYSFDCDHGGDCIINQKYFEN